MLKDKLKLLGNQRLKKTTTVNSHQLKILAFSREDFCEFHLRRLTNFDMGT
jgi:hypothetical protein